MGPLPLKRSVPAPHPLRRVISVAFFALISLPVPPIHAQSADDGSFLTADLHFRSIPAGATVSIDGRTVGTTPLTVSNIRPGRRRVRVTFRGYSPVDQWVDIPAEETVERTFELEPLRRTIHFESNADTTLEAYINGGWHPVSTLELSPGTHPIRFRAFGYRPRRQRVSADAELDAPKRVLVSLEPVETPTVRVAGISDPIRATNGTLLSPLIVEVVTDAPVEIRLDVTDSEGSRVYTMVKTLDRRATRITWDGRVSGKAGADQTGYETTKEHISDAPVPNTRYAVAIRGTDHELPGAPITRTFTIESRAERRAEILWLNGFGTPLFPLPVTSTQTRYVATVGGGSRYEYIDTAKWSVPAYFRAGAILFEAVVLSASGELSVAADETEPTGLYAFNLGTIRYALHNIVTVTAHVGMTADEITGGSVEESRFRGDLPVSVQLGPVRLAAVPGIRFDAGQNFASVDRVFPAAGGAVSVDHRALRVTLAGELRRYRSPLRSGDIRQRYSGDIVYDPATSPVSVYAALVLNNLREGYGVRGEVGVALSIRQALRQE